VYGIGRGSGWLTPVLALGGYLFWTLTEYWLHRIVFHFEPSAGIGARLHWIIHGVHHDHPNDRMRLVMPPSVSVPLALLFVWASGPCSARPRSCVRGGLLAGYLAYDMLHYHVHHHTPTTALGRTLRELHMRHHFQDHERGYGVSAPFWDHVFAPRRSRGRSRPSAGPALPTRFSTSSGMFARLSGTSRTRDQTGPAAGRATQPRLALVLGPRVAGQPVVQQLEQPRLLERGGGELVELREAGADDP